MNVELQKIITSVLTCQSKKNSSSGGNTTGEDHNWQRFVYQVGKKGRGELPKREKLRFI